MEKNYIILAVLFLVLFLNKAQAVVTPPPAFGRATQVQVAKNGSYYLVNARNIRGDVYRAVWHEPTGIYRTDFMSGSVLRNGWGAYSSNTIQGRVSRTVPKAAAMGKIFGNVKTVGSLAFRNLPIGRALLAYEILKELLEQEGYEYDDQQETFIDTKHEFILRFKTLEYYPERWVIRIQRGISIELYKKGYEKGWKPLADSICKQVTGSFAYNKWVIEEGYQVIGSGIGSGCVYEKDGDIRSSGLFEVIPNPYLTMTAEEFARIVSQEVESQLKKYLEPIADQLRWSEPTVYLFPGQIAQSNPYTNPYTGRPEQVRWKVIDDPRAPGEKSIVEEEIIARPDLTPNSPEAPALNPDTRNDTGTGTGTGTSTGNDDKKQPSSTENLCEKNPDILACQKMGEPQESFFDDVKIPHITDGQTWEEDTFLPSTGTCPQPKTFYIFGRPVELSYLPICKFLDQVRFIILAAFILMSAYLTFGSLRRE